MTARPHYDPEAGEWVAYRDQPVRRWNQETKKYEDATGIVRCYLWRPPVVQTGRPDDCVRYDTKAEALAAARQRWPRRVAGCRVGAEKVSR